VVVLIVSVAVTAQETAAWLVQRGQRVGVLTVRLFRPFSVADFAAALPATARAVAVLDRTKEPGAVGDPLYLDVVTALREAHRETPLIVGGRYGLGSKEFTPAMVRAVSKLESPRRKSLHGRYRRRLHTASLPVDPDFDEPRLCARRVLRPWLGRHRRRQQNSIKIISERPTTGRKATSSTTRRRALTISSALQPAPDRAPYLIRRASFVACHQRGFSTASMSSRAPAPRGVFLLNAPYGPEAIWEHLPREVQAGLLEKHARVFVIDAYRVAREAGLVGRINTIMQTCFFAIADVLPPDDAIARIKESIEKSYGKAGPAVIEQYRAAVDRALAHLHEVTLPAAVTATRARPPIVAAEAPDFVRGASPR
jgi:pyruvate-ferredoxin/flavodoxin oxidoreductase